MKVRFASLVSPRGLYGTKYHDVVLKRDVRRFLTKLKGEIILNLGDENLKDDGFWGDETSDFINLIDKLAGDVNLDNGE